MSVQPQAAIRTGLRAKQVQGRLVAVDLETGDYHVLNAVGALIWQGMEKQQNRQDIVRTITSSFAVTTEKAASDVDTFLDDLKSRGLVL